MSVCLNVNVFACVEEAAVTYEHDCRWQIFFSKICLLPRILPFPFLIRLTSPPVCIPGTWCWSMCLVESYLTTWWKRAGSPPKKRGSFSDKSSLPLTSATVTPYGLWDTAFLYRYIFIDLIWIYNIRTANHNPQLVFVCMVKKCFNPVEHTHIVCAKFKWSLSWTVAPDSQTWFRWVSISGCKTARLEPGHTLLLFFCISVCFDKLLISLWL